MIRLSILVLAGFILVSGHVRVAYAAPQILAALPVGEPYKLFCHEGVCDAEFSAICLQPRRPAPASHTPYQILAEDIGHLTLTGLTREGVTVTLPATTLRVASLRSQTSVRFFINEDVLEQRRLQSVSVAIDRMVSLLPVPAEDGSSAQTTDDIAKASSGIERIGKAWAEVNVDNLTIARITARIGNELPKIGRMEKGRADQLLDRAIRHEPKISAGALGSARQLVAICQRRSRFMQMRGCLEEYHDQIMLGLNGKYWTALRPGS